MTVHIALLRAVNVGGTGKLPMSELKALAEGLGLRDVSTYIQSGNLIFSGFGDLTQLGLISFSNIYDMFPYQNQLLII